MGINIILIREDDTVGKSHPVRGKCAKDKFFFGGGGGHRGIVAQ